MRVRLLRSFANPDVKMKCGMILDLEEKVAKYYVEHGKAEYVIDPITLIEKTVPPVIEKAVREFRETAVKPKPVEVKPEIKIEPVKIQEKDKDVIASPVEVPKKEKIRFLKKRKKK